MQKDVAIVSLHFSPAHASHLMAYGKMMRSMGMSVCYVLDEPYLRFADFAAVGTAASAARYLADPGMLRFEMAIFENPAVGNAAAARRMRAQGIKVLYVFHEPVPVRMRLKEGWKEILKLIVARYCSIAMLRQSSAVLVASNYARNLYARHFARYNSNVHTFPLLFDDESKANEATGTFDGKPYFSFLGLALKAHDFDGYCEFVKYAVRAGSSIRFAIATRTDLSGYLGRDQELARHEREGRILIQHGKTLTNEEMNSFCARSFCVWNIYTCSTQSGALVRAFMTGTPVIAARMGSFAEFIEPGVNGELVDRTDGLEAMLKAAETIRASIDAYSAGARRCFLDTFDYRTNCDRFRSILTETGKDTPRLREATAPSVCAHP